MTCILSSHSSFTLINIFGTGVILTVTNILPQAHFEMKKGKLVVDSLSLGNEFRVHNYVNVEKRKRNDKHALVQNHQWRHNNVKDTTFAKTMSPGLKLLYVSTCNKEEKRLQINMSPYFNKNYYMQKKLMKDVSGKQEFKQTLSFSVARTSSFL